MHKSFLMVCQIQVIWATTRQNQQNKCAPSEDSDQPGHPPSLSRVFAVRQWVAKGGCPGWSESSLGAQSLFFSFFVLFCFVLFVFFVFVFFAFLCVSWLIYQCQTCLCKWKIWNETKNKNLTIYMYLCIVYLKHSQLGKNKIETGFQQDYCFTNVIYISKTSKV